MEAGIDSLAATELASRLRSLTGVASLSSTLIYEQPTPRAIAAHLIELIGIPSASTTSSHTPPADASASTFARSVTAKVSMPFDEAHPCLILLRDAATSEHSAPPLVIAHNIVGDTQVYTKLISSALHDRRIFGLLHAAHRGADATHGDAADMLEEYSSAILAALPARPFGMLSERSNLKREPCSNLKREPCRSPP